MPGKKKKEEEEKRLTEAEDDLLTDEEKAALKTEEEPKGEPEGEKEDEPKKEAKPKEEPKEEVKEDKPKEKEDEPGEKPPEKLPEKPVDLKEGQEVTFIVDGKEVKGTYLPSGRIYFDGDAQRWISSKDGQGVIPFGKLEEERQKVSELQAKLTALEAARAAAPKVEEPKTGELTEADLEKLESEFYDTDNPREFIQKIRASKPAGEVEEKPVALTPEQIQANAEKQLALDTGMKKILGSFPAFDKEHKDYKGDDIAYVWTILGTKVLTEKVEQLTKGIADAAQKEAITQAWIGNVENLLTSAQEAAERTMKVIGTGGAPIDENALREAIRKEEATRALDLVKQKLNLSEQDVRTLGDVRDGAGEAGASKFAELDSKSGEELEEAIEGMSDKERDDYLHAETKT